MLSSTHATISTGRSVETLDNQSGAVNPRWSVLSKLAAYASIFVVKLRGMGAGMISDRPVGRKSLPAHTNWGFSAVRELRKTV